MGEKESEEIHLIFIGAEVRKLSTNIWFDILYWIYDAHSNIMSIFNIYFVIFFFQLVRVHSFVVDPVDFLVEKKKQEVDAHTKN